MAKSKYQKRAQSSIKKNKENGGPYYYDENIKKRKNSGIAVFAIFVLLIVGGVGIVGSLLNNVNVPANADLNPYYTENTNTAYDSSDTNGYKMPISITILSGQTINLADHAGKVVVLYFHYLTCTYCHYHSPELEAASQNFNTDELLVIAISVSSADTPTALMSWASDNGYSFELVKDTDYSLSSQFGAQYTPHTVYLAPDGDASTTHTGAQSEAEITATISALLG